MNGQATEIRKWIDFACDSNDVPELKHKIDFQFNTTFTRRLGDATYRREKGRGRIRLSAPLWARASEKDQYETVIHEACHIIVDYKVNGKWYTRRPQMHGIEWKAAMHACGISADRCHKVDRKGIARKQKRYIISTCPNQGADHKCRLSARRFGRLKAGVGMYCKTCNITIHYHDVEEDDYEQPAAQT